MSAQEQDSMWHVCDNVLKYIEDNKVEPEFYAFGSSGPEKVKQLLKKHNVDVEL